MSGPYEKAYDIVTQAWGDKKSSTEVPYKHLGVKYEQYSDLMRAS